MTLSLGKCDATPEPRIIVKTVALLRYSNRPTADRKTSRGEERMYVSCGCGKADDDHGDKRNLTMKHIEDAAKAAKSDPKGVAENIRKSVASK